MMNGKNNRENREMDERQQQVAGRIGMVSFLVMFLFGAAVIVAELLWKGDLMLVAGETVVLLAGGITCLAGTVRNGLWNGKSGKTAVWQQIFQSILFSGIFSVFYAFAISRKVSSQTLLGRYVLGFFVGIGLLCFLCLTLLEKTAGRQQRKQEQKYD